MTRPASDHHRNATNTQKNSGGPPSWLRRGLYSQLPSGWATTAPTSHITGVRQPERQQHGRASIGQPALDTHNLSTRLARERGSGWGFGGARGGEDGQVTENRWRGNPTAALPLRDHVHQLQLPPAARGQPGRTFHATVRAEFAKQSRLMGGDGGAGGAAPNPEFCLPLRTTLWLGALQPPEYMHIRVCLCVCVRVHPHIFHRAKETAALAQGESRNILPQQADAPISRLSDQHAAAADTHRSQRHPTFSGNGTTSSVLGPAEPLPCNHVAEKKEEEEETDEEEEEEASAHSAYGGVHTGAAFFF